MRNAEGNLMSIAQVATRLGGVSKWTIHSWLSNGRLRRTKIGARTMISEADLQAFIASCNQGPTPPGNKAA